MSMKVFGLKAQDLRNINIVEVDLRGKNWIEINGKNGAAKTTFIDILFLSMIGTKYLGRGYPAWRIIRKGKDRAIVKAVIGNEERKIEIKRTITRKEIDGKIETGGTLTTTDTAGKSLSQNYLDHLISEFTVDPLSFQRKSAREQIDLLKRLGGIDTTKIEEKYEDVKSKRTNTNRDIKRLEGYMVQMADIKEVELVDMDKLFKERNEIDKFNDDQRMLKAKVEAIDCNITTYAKSIFSIDSQIAALREERKTKSDLLDRAQVDLEDIHKPEQEKNFEAVELQIKNAEKTNHDARLYKNKVEKEKELIEKKEYSAKLTGIMNTCIIEKNKQIQDSKLPFKNIQFDEAVGILIDGIPLSQKSRAEQIKISARIGIEMHPELKILCIKVGSILDSESYEVLKELAEEYDYQILVETVGERPGENCIVMRAGAVISRFEKPKTAMEKVRDMNLNL